MTIPLSLDGLITPVGTVPDILIEEDNPGGTIAPFGSLVFVADFRVSDLGGEIIPVGNLYTEDNSQCFPAIYTCVPEPVPAVDCADVCEPTEIPASPSLALAGQIIPIGRLFPAEIPTPLDCPECPPVPPATQPEECLGDCVHSTVLAVDMFTGGDDADIDTRVPDGGGDPILAIGLWDKATGSTLGIVSGAVEPTSGVTYAHYVLKNIDSRRNSRVVAVVTYSALFGQGDIGLACNHSDVAADGYELRYANIPSYGGVSQLTLYGWNAGTPVQIAGTAVLAVPALDTDIVLQLDVVDTVGGGRKLFGTLNGEVMIMVDDDPNMGFNWNTGYVGLIMPAGQTPNVHVKEFTVYEESSVPCPCVAGFQKRIAVDTFTGGLDTDIDLRPVDGGGIAALQNGSWAKNRPLQAWTLGTNADSTLGYVDPGPTGSGDGFGAHYTIEGIVGLPASYSVEAIFAVHTFPTDLTQQVAVLANFQSDSWSGYKFEANPIPDSWNSGPGTGGWQFNLFRITNGGFVLLGASPKFYGEPSLDVDYRLRIDVRSSATGARICCYFDNELMITTLDDDTAPINPPFLTGSPGVALMDGAHNGIYGGDGGEVKVKRVTVTVDD